MTDDDDGRQRTDDGPLIYYKLTLWAFGSGELITYFDGLSIPSELVEQELQQNHLLSLTRRSSLLWTLSMCELQITEQKSRAFLSSFWVICNCSYMDKIHKND